jgi:hypothetical protein
MWGFVQGLVDKRVRAKQLLSEVIGMYTGDALRKIKEAQLDVTVLSIDGLVCTNDGRFDPDRIGIVIQGGQVTGAQIG